MILSTGLYMSATFRLRAVLLSSYSIYRAEPIFLVGYLVTLGIYLRNLWITRWPGSRERASSPSPG